MTKDSKFVPVLETDSIMDITMIKTTLDSEDVLYFIQGENMKFLDPFHQVATLMVADNDVQRVKALLDPLKLTYVRYKALS